MNLFTAQINGWDDWENVYQSVLAFAPLIEHVLRKEQLPAAEIERLTPGTNAVFKVGDVVIKIFAPAESGMDQTLDLQTELFAARHAYSLGVRVPKVIANGFVHDKYDFAYIITEFVHGVELAQTLKTMTADEKIKIGQALRCATNKMNIPCACFNGIDVIHDRSRDWRWEGFSAQFKAERLAHIALQDFDQRVFVHGDLNLDNVLLSPNGELCVIDFADAVLAPALYEHALMPFSFEFDPTLLRGYFGDYSSGEFIDMCLNGLLIHDFGGDIAKEHFGVVDSLDILRKALEQKLLISA
ncbi:MAG: aminoglycoside phosphotransferase family protein [Oscillospiraceae bacterium]|nr:aminoglycoside phosphotransferase family protein [Oscillospiraceae bacterium]